jgi:hypothetical protein
VRGFSPAGSTDSTACPCSAASTLSPVMLTLPLLQQETDRRQGALI